MLLHTWMSIFVSLLVITNTMSISASYLRVAPCMHRNSHVRAMPSAHTTICIAYTTILAVLRMCVYRGAIIKQNDAIYTRKRPKTWVFTPRKAENQLPSKFLCRLFLFRPAAARACGFAASGWLLILCVCVCVYVFVCYTLYLLGVYTHTYIHTYIPHTRPPRIPPPPPPVSYV
jgi:hypothetical protein